jgi:hypothetical protein
MHRLTSPSDRPSSQHSRDDAGARTNFDPSKSKRIAAIGTGSSDQALEFAQTAGRDVDYSGTLAAPMNGIKFAAPCRQTSCVDERQQHFDWVQTIDEIPVRPSPSIKLWDARDSKSRSPVVRHSFANELDHLGNEGAREFSSGFVE